MFKWADILQREEALTGKGDIIPQKALEVYERAKEMIEMPGKAAIHTHRR